MEWSEIITPVNVILGGVIAYLLKNLLSSPSLPPPPKKPRKEPAPRNFTVAELSKYDGCTPSEEFDGEKPIYLACDGVVFDVSSRASFYGPEGPYACFAGRDASRGLATMDLKLEATAEWDDLSNLSPQERQTMHEWRDSFEGKYPIRGKLVRSHEEQQDATGSPEPAKM